MERNLSLKEKELISEVAKIASDISEMIAETETLKEEIRKNK